MPNKDKDKTRKELGKKIRKAREKAGLTQTIRSLKFSETDRSEFVRKINQELEDDQSYAKTEAEQQTRRYNRLQAERERFLQAYYTELISDNVLKSEQKRLSVEIEQAETVISKAQERIEIIKSRKERALTLAENFNTGSILSKGNMVIRRYLCQALFSSIALDDQATFYNKRIEHHVKVTGVNWNSPLNIHHLAEAVLALSLETEPFDLVG